VSLPGHTRPQAIHVNELRTAVNSVRTAAGLGSGTFGPAATSGAPLTDEHIVALRTALNEALVKMGAPPMSFSSPPAHHGVVRASHLQDLRQACR
jgi:hypothetical protein